VQSFADAADLYGIEPETFIDNSDTFLRHGRYCATEAGSRSHV
jgi:hypothetical protein